MLTAIKRALIRTRVRMINIEIALAESAEADVKKRLEELARKEVSLRMNYTSTLPIGMVRRWEA